MANNSITVVVHPNTFETDPAFPTVDRNKGETGSLSLKVDWRDNQNTWQAVRVYGFEDANSKGPISASPPDVLIPAGDSNSRNIQLMGKIDQDGRIVKYKIDYVQGLWTADPVFREIP